MHKTLLNAADLTSSIDEKSLPFARFSDLQASSEFLGQDRAIEAMHFGLTTKQKGYNLFVMGERGDGRLSIVTHHLESKAKIEKCQSDWVYVNNFEEPTDPWAMQLPSGVAKKLLDDCKNLISQLMVSLSAAIENPAYQRKKTSLDKSFNRKVEAVISEIEKMASSQSIALYQEGGDVSFSPIIDGKPVDDVVFAGLSQSNKDHFNRLIDRLEEELVESLLEMPQWKRKIYDKVKRLNKETISKVVSQLFDEIEDDYLGLAGVQIYFKESRKHLVDLILDYIGLLESSESKDNEKLRDTLLHSFVPNLLVANNQVSGAPVVFESRPSYSSLFGQIDYWNEQGITKTSFQHIRCGALHRANGGYLVLEVEKLLADPVLWRQLKQALQTKEIKLSPPTIEYLPGSTTGLNPHGVPLDVKVILVGERDFYYWLEEFDSEFGELFRVLVDFSEDMEASRENIEHLARLVKAHCEKDNIGELNNRGFIELLKYSARRCGHQNKLSTRLSEIFEILSEAEVVRRARGDDQLSDNNILEAQANREYRHSRIRDEMLDKIIEGQVLIETAERRVGSINGLTIWRIGSSEFAMPARITATVFPGKKGIIDIEKESQLGLSLHSKGVMIISGYLANRYAKAFPLTLSANIVMEQSYGLVDGDSASLAEICCLISAVSDCPIRQSLAVTGSVSQFGEVQAVGGINEKIEGFFNICQKRGLDGNHGVIIPKANSCNLVLNKQVIEAVERKQFKVYAVENIDQAVELLCLEPEESIDTLSRRVSGELEKLYLASKVKAT
ncbi:AAA family ATPase [Aliikangiella sp. G2MR2-5]|uniref:AAA family ATPase n=1 Tax=Aliikangiella sp. G2MR2-5 TaxID=2788943 RepID=UPI0018AB7F5E|nr:AAA family ATPase [Aliikangiella sp. G2MR2-5]